MKNSKIEWCDHTFNPWVGCAKVSAGCTNCYAETLMDARYGRVQWGKGNPRQRTSEVYWKQPLKWNREAADPKLGTRAERPRVFCGSLCDWLDEEVPIGWLFDLLKLPASTSNLDWLLLTKRPENLLPRMRKILEWFPTTRLTLEEARGLTLADAFLNGGGTVMQNIWIGTSVENQEMAEKRIPELLKIPAKVRFLSCEPLLGPIRLNLPTRKWEGGNGYIGCAHCCHKDRCDDPSHYDRRRCPHCRGTGLGNPIHWVICGGESGAKARPMHPDWACSLRDQCVAAHVSFFFKQWGEWCPAIETHGVTGSIMPSTGERFTWIGWNGRTANPSATELLDPVMAIARIGKHAAGRVLGGREWNEFPAT